MQQHESVVRVRNNAQQEWDRAGTLVEVSPGHRWVFTCDVCPREHDEHDCLIPAGSLIFWHVDAHMRSYHGYLIERDQETVTWQAVEETKR